MATVELNVDKLTAARTAVSTLASSIDSQRHLADNGTPVALNTLSDGSALSRTSTWLLDQVSPLQQLIDLAQLLDVDHKGSVSYDGTGSVDETTRLLSEQIAQGLKDIGDVDSLEDRERLSTLAEVFGRYANDPAVAGPVVAELGPEGTIDALHQLRGLIQIDGAPPYYIADGLEQTEEAQTINKLQDSLAASLAIAVGAASRAGQLTDDFGKHLVEHSGDGWAIGTLFHYGDLNNVDFGTQLLVSSGEELLDREENFGWQQWQVNQHTPTRFGIDGGDDKLVDDPTLQWLNVLDNNPDASQTILLDEGRAKYLLGERNPPYEDPPGDAAGDVLRTATIDQALGFDPTHDQIGGPEDIRAKNAAQISSNTLDMFGEGAEALSGVDEEIGGIIATYIGDVERVSQVQDSAERPGVYAKGEDLPGWLKNRGLPEYGINIDRNDLIDILNDVGGNDVAASTVGEASTRLNQVRLQDGIDHVLKDDLESLEVGEDDSFSASVKNSAMLNGFLTDSLLNGDIDDAKEVAEDRKRVAGFFTMPLDAIPTDHTGPVGGYVVGQVKDAIIGSYVGDGVPDAISDANSKFGATASSTTMQALFTLVGSDYTSPDGSTSGTMPIGDLASDWPKDDFGHPKPPSELSNTQISKIIYSSKQGGKGYALSTAQGVDGAIHNLNEWYK